MIIKKYDTDKNSNELFIQFKNEKNVMFLDSSKTGYGLGNYSVLVANPRHIVQFKNNQFFLDDQMIGHDPFSCLQQLIDNFKQTYTSELPFVGGFVGFLNYDLKNYIERLNVTTVDDIQMPDLFFGIYDGAVVINHMTNEVFLTDVDDDGNGETRLNQRISIIKKNQVHEPWLKHDTPCIIKSNFEKSTYLEAVEKIRQYIRSGDIYQANMTQRFKTTLRETPFQLYQKLRRINPAPFSSYIDFGTGYVVSSSPERFIKINAGVIETRPIKGTMPRHSDPVVDKKNRDVLLNSKKDQSELLMIVDLERNDLSKIAKTGSVKVTELFKLETYETVYHLVATVIAEVDDKYTLEDVLKATFPGGSITGAPKIRAMEIIDELEPTSRALYTGSIGYIDFNQNMDLNIVIRTFVCKDGEAYFQAGGGIVWDSDPESEYQESLDKAFALIKTLNYGVDDVLV